MVKLNTGEILKKLLGDREYSLLVNAFENKTNFTWSRNSYSSKGRDLSISAKLCEDGIYRAWFSSEFSGCANGDYYLLISPNIAVYYERD